MTHVHRHHGLPEVIISDRDRIFTSALWQDLFKLSDTALHMSSAYSTRKRMGKPNVSTNV